MAVSPNGLTFNCPFGCLVWLEHPITAARAPAGHVAQLVLDEDQLRLAVASHLAGSHAGQEVT